MEINSAKELHSILLNIAKEFHRICDKYGIPYYMLGGTMLGAIRHKGFIPWDDDMDFGVPREHYDYCISMLKKELPTNYEILTIDNTEAIIGNIVKISDSRTEIIEQYKENITKRIGVNIDIFPLDSVCKETYKSEIISRLLQLQGWLFLPTKYYPTIKMTIIYLFKLLFFFLPKKSIIKYIEGHLKGNQGSFTVNIYGAWGIKEMILQSVIGKPTLYNFEDTKLYGIENASAYLTSLYGDYMTLPPESKRHFHIKNVYWK